MITKSLSYFITSTFAVLLLLLVSFSTFSQKPTRSDKKAIQRLKKDVTALASDKYEGREAGTTGEFHAAFYIFQRFMQTRLSPRGTNNNFFQPFEFKSEVTLGERNFLILNTKTFKPGRDYYPVSYSQSGSANAEIVKVGYGIQDDKSGYNDYKGLGEISGKIFVIELSSPDGIHPHSKYSEHSGLQEKISLASSKGASGIIFINSDINLEPPSLELSKQINPVSIPVIFATGMAYKLIMDATVVKAEVNVDINRELKVGWNVIGYLDNGAMKTVVIGAHYDHLGFIDVGEEKIIFNGADDNASGVAAMIELAHLLKRSKYKNNNYLFVAFSGEEKGLLGSSYFLKNSTVDIGTINYMLNLDMVGRLNQESKILQVHGSGTSPLWQPTIAQIKNYDLKIKTTKAGIGPSDHVSFYLQGIPVLHFFSGLHADYHQPSDDAEKINFEGQNTIVKYILALIGKLDDREKLTFTKTKEDENYLFAPKFSVTLGIIPDYLYEGKGLRIAGVSEGKPAEKSGLLEGDIIIRMGDFDVVDMMSYMKSLGHFKKGEKTIVIIKRGEEKLEKEVQF